MARLTDGIRAGLENERQRIERIARGQVGLRPELRTRRDEIGAALRLDLERVHRLLAHLANAPEEDAARVTRTVHRAWRLLRNRILKVLARPPGGGAAASN